MAQPSRFAAVLLGILLCYSMVVWPCSCFVTPVAVALIHNPICSRTVPGLRGIFTALCSQPELCGRSMLVAVRYCPLVFTTSHLHNHTSVGGLLQPQLAASSPFPGLPPGHARGRWVVGITSCFTQQSQHGSVWGSGISGILPSALRTWTNHSCFSASEGFAVVGTLSHVHTVLACPAHGQLAQAAVLLCKAHPHPPPVNSCSIVGSAGTMSGICFW